MRMFRPRNIGIFLAVVFGLWVLSWLYGIISSQMAPETYLNSFDQKAMYASQAQQAGLHYDDGAFNPQKLWAPGGSTAYELTGRAKGIIRIEGPIKVTVFMPRERIEETSGGYTSLSETKIAALMDTDGCSVTTDTHRIGSAVQVTVHDITCKGGSINLGDGALITVYYTGPSPYQDSVMLTGGTTRPFSIQQSLLTPVPGE